MWSGTVTLLNHKIYNRVEESSIAPAQQQSVSTATARTLYNSSRYEPNHYDPYYALYDEDSELYRDVGKLKHANKFYTLKLHLARKIQSKFPDYHQQYTNNNNAGQQQTSQQTYRGTPAPAVQTSSAAETPKRGSTGYIQNNYSPQDVYQQSTLSDYTEDNYNTQVCR